MTRLTVSYDDLHTAARELVARRDRIHEELESTRVYIAHLVSTGFVTERASVRFEESAQRFTTGAQGVIEGLAEMGAYLAEVAATLADVDAQLASRLQ